MAKKETTQEPCPACGSRAPLRKDGECADCRTTGAARRALTEKTTHTPLPWTLPNGDECALDGWHYREGARYSRCLGAPLCPVQALHAAAPDLLDAAREVADAFWQMPPDHPVHKLRAAIAKAEGKRGRGSEGCACRKFRSAAPETPKEGE